MADLDGVDDVGDATCVLCDVASGWFMPPSADSCLPCATGCLTCTGAGSDLCGSCDASLSYYLNGTTCLLCSGADKYWSDPHCIRSFVDAGGMTWFLVRRNA